MDSALVVQSVREEYEHVAAQRCACGGTYARQSQALCFNEQQVPFDRISAQCTSCNAVAEFWFNCSAFFGKPFWEKPKP